MTARCKSVSRCLHYDRAKGFSVWPSVLESALKNLGDTYKETLMQTQADKGARHGFQNNVKNYKETARLIISIDESGFTQEMPRPHRAMLHEANAVKTYRRARAKGRVNVIAAVSR